MAMVTTNVRLPEEEYRKYRLIALKKRKSFAELVRQSLERANWTFDDEKKDKERRAAAGRILRVKRFKSNMSIREMIEKGRRF